MVELITDYPSIFDGFVISHKGEPAGFTIWEEAFADRRYLSNGVLAPRNAEGAVISDPSLVWQQLQSLIRDKRVKSSEGAWIYMQPKTYCIHGDTAGAHEILLYIAQMFKEEFK